MIDERNMTKHQYAILLTYLVFWVMIVTFAGNTLISICLAVMSYINIFSID
jgi:hypothetical protein